MLRSILLSYRRAGHQSAAPSSLRCISSTAHLSGSWMDKVKGIVTGKKSESAESFTLLQFAEEMRKARKLGKLKQYVAGRNSEASISEACEKEEAIIRYLAGIDPTGEVPVTNFFGSVMETIHTDSTYRAFSGKNSRKSSTAMPPDQSGLEKEKRRALQSADVPEELADSETNAEQVNCPFTRTWTTILNRMEKMKQIDSVVNYGLALMFPIVALSSWISC